MQYGMLWYGTVWYGMLWYGMVRYGMLCPATVARTPWVRRSCRTGLLSPIMAVMTYWRGYTMEMDTMDATHYGCYSGDSMGSGQTGV